ncbi:MAG: hypothetical protein DRQ35_03115 [Gammaproteobacteria bacterium]|nr:MAG: hypothetical protein DRQ35_03115 [Gammaproteobacteria bacterium]
MRKISKDFKHLVYLADGSNLWYKYPRCKGDQFYWKYSYDNYGLRSALKSKKIHSPTLGLLNSGTDHIILAADFDIIPSHLRKDSLSEQTFWEKFYQEALTCYEDTAKVARSHSGKVKIFCPFVLPEGLSAESLSRCQKEAILKKFLFTEHHWFDCRYAGLSVAYLNENLIRVLQKVKTLIPTNIVIDNKTVSYTDIPYTVCLDLEANNKIKKDINNGNIYIPSESTFDSTLSINENSQNSGSCEKAILESKVKQFYKSEDRLPAFSAFYNIRSYRGGEEFLRILLRTKNLLKPQGFGLPTNKLAKECSISTKQVSKLLKLSEEEAILKCVDPSYSHKIRSRKYVAVNELRNELINYFNDLMHPITSLPTTIEDHSWEVTLMSLKKYFNTPEQFKNYTENLPGIEKKDRRKKVDRIVSKWEHLS